MSPKQQQDIEKMARQALLAARGTSAAAKKRVSDEKIERLVKQQMEIVRKASA